jgi:hypothetical protein
MAAFIATSSSLADESKGPRVPDAAEAEKQVLSLSRQWVDATASQTLTDETVVVDRDTAVVGQR